MNTGNGLYEFMIHVCFAAGVVMLVIGILIMIAPQSVIRLGGRLNTWIPTDRFFEQLDRPKSSERMFYRYHVVSGMILAVASAYIFYIFVFSYDAERQILTLFSNRSANEWLTASLVFLGRLFSVLIFFAGLVIIFRPSLLKRFEAWGNRWLTVDRSLKTLDVQLLTPDRLFLKRPRLLGFIVVLGSLYILNSLWVMM